MQFPVTINDKTFNSQEELDSYADSIKAELALVNATRKQSKESSPNKLKTKLTEMVVESMNADSEVLEFCQSNFSDNMPVRIIFNKEDKKFVMKLETEKKERIAGPGVNGFPVVIDGTQYVNRRVALKELLELESIPRKKEEQENLLTNAGYEFVYVK